MIRAASHVKLSFMKKRLILCVTCITVVSIYVDAQNKTTVVTSPATTTESYVAVLPPPPPPPPPVPPIPPAPPPPPVAPIPPVAPAEDLSYNDDGPVIINNTGSEISIRTVNGRTMIIVRKDGKTQKIKLSTWNANRKYYEKKYGPLPPPPPPPPAPPVPAVEEVNFTPPVIKEGQ